MSPRLRQLLFGAFLVLLGAGMFWAYVHYVWYAGPTIAWTHDGQPYELLAPRMRCI